MLNSFVPPKILLHNINTEGGGNYRIIQPASLLRQYGFATTIAHPHRVPDEMLRTLEPDVVVFQMLQTEKQQQWIRDYRKILPKAHFVYEIDDLFWAVPEGSAHRNNPLIPGSQRRIREAARLCDTVVVSTDELAHHMRAATGMKDVRVLPNQVPLRFINAAVQGRRASQFKSDKLRVGWAGGVGHGGDLNLVAEIMRILGDTIQWVFMGMVPNGVDLGSVEYHQPVPYAQYPEKLGELNLDIALAPLEDNDFNRCKSDLRILEYGAAGFPVIASDIGPYHDSDAPVSVWKNDAQQWADIITEKASNTASLAADGQYLHDWVRENRCMDDHLLRYPLSYMPNGSTKFLPDITSEFNTPLATVGGQAEGLKNFDTIEEAFLAGYDVLYLRKGTKVSEHYLGLMRDALDKNASVSAFTNDAIYPIFGRFISVNEQTTRQAELAGMIIQPEPIECPFPSGPAILLSHTAMKMFGVPDVSRYKSIESAVAEWGTRCLEKGKKHLTLPYVFIRAACPDPDYNPQQVQKTFEHIAMWIPPFGNVLHAYQNSEAFLQAREDLDLAFTALGDSGPEVSSYGEWYRAYAAVTPAEKAWMKEVVTDWEKPPRVSVIMPVYNPSPDHLVAAIESVLEQTYPNWELVIADDASTDPEVHRILGDVSDDRIKVIRRPENGHICAASNTALEAATGDWVVFLDHDDLLTEHALFAVTTAIQANPDAKFIYSDSDQINPKGELCGVYSKPGFSYELLLAQNYVTHLSAYKLATVQSIGGFRLGFEGSQDWDLCLRYLAAEAGTPPEPKVITHIPSVLYHWRESDSSTSVNPASKPYAIEAGRRCVKEHLQRTGENAFLAPHPVIPIFNMVRFLVPDPAPSVTVIIPTKNNLEQLDRCLTALETRTAYTNFDVVVVDTDYRVNTALRQRLKKSPLKIDYMTYARPFNYAAINNMAVGMTDANFVCLLNDDVEVIEPGWLNDLVGLAMRPKVGAVGPKLLYPDMSVQQAGTMFCTEDHPGQIALHMWQRLPLNHPGQVGRAVITQPVIAVTGACLVISRALYQEMGGLDESFAIDFNDVDFCLRLHKAGYRNIVSAQALMVHHEGSTKKRTNAVTMDTMLAAQQKLFDKHSDVVDPYINPNLAFEPHQVRLRQPPPRLFDVGLEHVLLVNGDKETAVELHSNGYRAFMANVEGHFLQFVAPAMSHVRPIDLREPIDALKTILEKLNISRVVFCGIGDGTLGTVGFFAALAEAGFQTMMAPNVVLCHDTQGYYDKTGWDRTWQRLLVAAPGGWDVLSAA